MTDDRAAVDGYASDHAEVDDAPVQLGVLDRSQGVDDLASVMVTGTVVASGDFHYRA